MHVDIYNIYTYILYAFGFCKCCFLITWHYIAYTYTHTHTNTERERERHCRTDYKVVVATFRRMLFASCSECRKSSPAKATATATAAGKNTKIKLIYCIHRTVFVCVRVRVQAVFLPSLN